MKIGAKIQKIRELKGYTQESVADALGISQSAYCNIEKENTSVSMEKLIKIAEFFELTVPQLLAFDHKTIFNNISEGISIHEPVSELSNNERQLYESRIKHLEEEILFLRDKLFKK